MNKEFFEALEKLAQENGIPMELLTEKIKLGISRAVKKEYPDCEDFNVEIDPDKKEVSLMRTVVDDEPLDMSEIHIDEARASCSKNAAVGDVVPFKLSTAKFGRVAAQNAKQAIRTELKGFEREKYINQFSDTRRFRLPFSGLSRKAATLLSLSTKTRCTYSKMSRYPAKSLKRVTS